MLWFFSSKTFQASGFMSGVVLCVFPSPNQLHTICTINFRSCSHLLSIQIFPLLSDFKGGLFPIRCVWLVMRSEASHLLSNIY